MANTYNFANAGYYFGEAIYGEILTDAQIENLAIYFHEAPVHAQKETFGSDVLEQAGIYAKLAGFSNIAVTRGDGFTVNIQTNGRFAVNYTVDVYVDIDDMEKTMANGETAGNLEYYEWANFDSLQALANVG